MAKLIKNTAKFNFPKQEKLNKEKIIKELFSKSSSFRLYPFVIKFISQSTLIEQPNPYHQVLITIPKRKIKKAAQRNLLKRRVKEAYRLHKHLISQLLPNNSSLFIAYIYTSNDILTFSEIEAKMISSLKKLSTLV